MVLYVHKNQKAYQGRENAYGKESTALNACLVSRAGVTVRAVKRGQCSAADEILTRVTMHARILTTG